MCEIHELVRAFVLRPHKLYKRGSLLRGMVFNFESLQTDCGGTLDIFFIKDGGFAVCFPPDFPHEKIKDATPYLIHTLDVQPRLIDLAQFV